MECRVEGGLGAHGAVGRERGFSALFIQTQTMDMT